MTTTAEWRKWNALQTKPITKADQIRSKTDKELASWFAGRACPDIGECPYVDQEVYGDDRDCGKCWLNWLKQEADNGEN